MTYILLAIILLSYSGIPTIYYRIKFFCKSKLYNNSKILCLTFDDGPHEVYTVLSVYTMVVGEIKLP